MLINRYRLEFLVVFWTEKCHRKTLVFTTPSNALFTPILLRNHT